jgi:hypothetical protein
MKNSLASLFIIVVFITSCTKQSAVQPSSPNTTNVKFSISSKGIFAGESIIFTNESYGLKCYEWSDNDSIFDTKIEPSKRAFLTKGIHVIKLVGIDLNGAIYKFSDTLKVYDQFKVQEYKIINKSNIVFPIDSSKGVFWGFMDSGDDGTNFYNFCNNGGLYIGLDWDSSFNINSKFTNTFHKVTDNRMGKEVNNVITSNQFQDRVLCFHYNDFTNYYANRGDFYSNKIEFTKSTANGNSTFFENGDFLIELKGKPSY